MSLWTVLDVSERQMFHDMLIVDGWEPITNVIQFYESRAEPAYMSPYDGAAYTFSAAVEDGDAIPVWSADRAERGGAFAMAGILLIVGLVVFDMMKGK
jgi:hypothetical protein